MPAVRWHERRIEHWSRPWRFLAYAGMIAGGILVTWGIDTLSGESSLRVPLVLGLVFFSVYLTHDLLRPLLQRRSFRRRPSRPGRRRPRRLARILRRHRPSVTRP